MKVSKEELLHIANLANLKIDENEQEEYLNNLNDIIGFADILNNIATENISETIGSTDNENFFREDEPKEFENKEALLQNAPSKDNNMFKIPKVI